MPTKKKSERQSNFFEVCSKCKVGYACCFGTRPPITKERKKIIEAYLKKKKLPIVDAFVEADGYVFPKETVESYCIFHDTKTRKCLIHPVKPETCVAGPITFDVCWKARKIEWFVKMEKICPLAGVVYRDKKVLQMHLRSAKKEIIRLMRTLDSGELKAILAKDEPETVKIGEDPLESAS